MKRLLLLLLAFAGPAFAQGTLEVIPLRHRTAEQVIPILRPLLEPGGALSGQYNQLIVRTSPGNLAQIRSALDAIDRPARRLLISVRFDAAQDTARRDVQGAVRITSEGNSSAAVKLALASRESPAASASNPAFTRVATSAVSSRCAA